MNNRRKSYGRRQHELYERRGRDDAPLEYEAGADDLDAARIADRLGFLDSRTPRLHYASGD